MPRKTNKNSKKNLTPIPTEADMKVYCKMLAEVKQLEDIFDLKYENAMKKSGKSVNDAPDEEDIFNLIVELEADNFSNRLDNIHNNLYSSTTCTNTKGDI